MRTLLALFRRGRGRHRMQRTPVRPAVKRQAPTPPRYVIDGEEVSLVRAYLLAFEEQARQGRVEEVAA
ncbi:hypothetical protein [Streptomyces carpinensis]|uniref:Uncharacterized protein n=1 Tax=Streptomyces carpinensis TaxID=66369 RepID=A0ABV1VX70_9ACTN|nr:hypothetical protein [Streptomyces carpinensis]